MKVKNIAFSGFAAMIFAGLCGAADATSVNLASKSYVDRQLESKANLIDLEALETTVGQKATQESLNTVATQVNQNTLDIADLKAAGYISDTDLDNAVSTLEAVDRALQDAIDAIKNPDVDKAYVDKEISNLNTAISNLQGADSSMSQTIAGLEALVANAATKEEIKDFITSSAVDSKIQDAVAGLATDEEVKDFVSSGMLQEEIAKLATKSEIANFVNSTQVSDAIADATKDLLTASDVADFVKSGDMTTAIANATKDLATKQDLEDAKSELQAAIDGINAGQVELTNYYTKAQAEAMFATKAELPVIPTLVSAFINDAGYQTSTDVQGAITTAIANMATDQELANLKTTLETAIEEKQAKGEYLVAADLKTLNDAVTALQSGKADASTVTTIQETISKLGDTYATKSDMTAADTALQNAIDAIEIPSLADYAKTADVDAALALKADKSELTNLVTSTQLTELRTALETEIAKKQDSGDYAAADALTAISTELSTLKGDVYTKAQVDAKIADAVSGGEIDLSGYAKQVDLDSLTALVNGNTAEITTLKNAGYQTSTQVSEAIDTATATLATKDELNAKQDTLTAGAGITITDNTISASVDTESLITKPTEQPDTFGEYVLILNINEAGESEGYSWLDTLDLIGGVEEL